MAEPQESQASEIMSVRNIFHEWRPPSKSESIYHTASLNLSDSTPEVSIESKAMKLAWCYSSQGTNSPNELMI